MSIKLDLKNKIINGNFDFWQRGTSLAITNINAPYLADRWNTHRVGASWAYTTSRSTDVPPGSLSTYSLNIAVTTASTITSTDYALITQHIEGNILKTFKGKNMVLNFWVKATKTGTYVFSLVNGNSNDRRYLVEYTVNTSNTWEKKTIRFSHDTTGAWDYGAGTGMVCMFTLAAGSTFQTITNSWHTATQKFSTSNQVNIMDSTSNIFRLADVVLVEDNDGKTRDPDFMYAGRDYFEEFQLCQRYFEKSYDVATTLGTITTAGRFVTRPASANLSFSVSYKISKRVTSPIVTFYNPATGASGTCRNESAGTDLAISTDSSGQTGFSVNVGGATSSSQYAVHFASDAEL